MDSDVHGESGNGTKAMVGRRDEPLTGPQLVTPHISATRLMIIDNAKWLPLAFVLSLASPFPRRSSSLRIENSIVNLFLMVPIYDRSSVENTPPVKHFYVAVFGPGTIGIDPSVSTCQVRQAKNNSIAVLRFKQSFSASRLRMNRHDYMLWKTQRCTRVDRRATFGMSLSPPTLP